MKITIGQDGFSTTITNDDGTPLSFPIASVTVSLEAPHAPEIQMVAYLPAGSTIQIDARNITVKAHEHEELNQLVGGNR